MEEEQPQGEEEDRRVQLQEGSGRMRTGNCPQAWAPEAWGWLWKFSGVHVSVGTLKDARWSEL